MGNNRGALQREGGGGQREVEGEVIFPPSLHLSQQQCLQTKHPLEDETEDNAPQ